MKITTYVIYGLWIVLAILASIFLHASWWVGLSWLWIPASVILVIVLGLNASVDIGKWLKIREIKKTPNTCENCLFGKTSKFDSDDQCLGEKLDETIHRPTLCKYYRR